MFCRKCGTQMSDDSNFCTVCGVQRLPTAPGQPTCQPVPQQTFSQAPQQPIVYVKPKIPGRGFGISSLVLGIVGLVYACVFLIEAILTLIAIPHEALAENPLSFLFTLLISSSLPIMALFFGIAACRRGYQCLKVKSGLVMGCVGMAGYFVAAILTLITLFL